VYRDGVEASRGRRAANHHMTTTAAPSFLFATASLARRIERAEAELIADGAAAAGVRLGEDRVFLQRVAGGVAAFADDGSPFNKVAGVGFEGVPEDDVLAAIEREGARRQTAVQFEIASLADPDVARCLTRRGYEIVGFENVLGLALTPGAPQAPDEGGTSTRITSVGPDENAMWLDTVATGFLQPDAIDGPPSHETFDRSALERVFADTIVAPGFERYLAWRDNDVAGGASLRMHDGIAQLCGAATLPAHRRQGVQSALLHYRLALAATRGCDLAVVTTQPGSKSQQNVQRFGFALLYARAVLVKRDPP